jgi:hypothetical protein
MFHDFSPVTDLYFLSELILAQGQIDVNYAWVRSATMPLYGQLRISTAVSETHQ